MMSIAARGFAAALTFALAIGCSAAAAAGGAMPVKGKTSQPVGHYDFCQRYAEECGPNARQGVVQLSRSAWAQMVEVNGAVNTSIFPRTDDDMHGVPELWSYPTTEGDCEDYALLKQYMLERAGFPRAALLMTVARQPNGDGHAVLTVRTSKGDFILDNLVDAILDWRDTDYTFLKRQSEANSARWVAIADDRNMLVGSVR